MELNNLISRLNKEGGPARTNRYKVQIIPPLIMGTVKSITNIITNGLGGAFDAAWAARYYAMFLVNPVTIMENLEIMCDTCSLPGASFDATTRKTYGPHSMIPFDQNFDSMNFTFLCGAHMKERYFFDIWQYAIKDPLTNNFNYPIEYMTQVIIRQFDTSDNFQYGVRLVDAWPISVNAIDMSYGDQGTCRVNVTLSFKRWFNLKAFDTYASDAGDIAKQFGL